ncbi:MAG: hypothetical protein U0Y82_07940 [Thermoleophilia bacterium]
MSEVSYQSFLPATGAAVGAELFVPLPRAAVRTRRKDATTTLRVRVSPRQAKWLSRVAAESGAGVDADAVVRAMLDVARELDVDWAMLAGGGMLREAVRTSVRVRREGG